ncbi:uncharacterized protein [Nicotiana tomentosiformis]|uniref:uncharacterized protein n=1 Tax=Nicotiana tomentosiformis TaxID=4098 RepID=UPI00388C789A
MGIVETNRVDFAVFQMTGSAKRWWRDYMLTRPVGSPALTWEQFSQLCMEKFLPITLKEDFRRQFERLQQGIMTVAQYETRFVDLARHAVLLLPIERERVRSFIDGLTYPIRLQMAKETGCEISFQADDNITRRIEMVLEQERGHGSHKRPRQFGGFSVASSGGRAMEDKNTTRRQKILTNPSVELSDNAQVIASHARNNINQSINMLKEYDTREKVAIEQMLLLDQINATRQIGWWESIDKLNADEVAKFEAWLNGTVFKLKSHLERLENEVSSSSQVSPENTNNAPNAS